MGKTLSILSLIVKTLDVATEWAQKQESSATVEEEIQRSRSTLVIVPSARLLILTLDSIVCALWLTSSDSFGIQLDRRDRQVRFFPSTAISVLTSQTTDTLMRESRKLNTTDLIDPRVSRKS